MHDELDLSPEQRAWIASARNDVRNCLRTGIPRVLRERGYTDDAPQPQGTERMSQTGLGVALKTLRERRTLSLREIGQLSSVDHA
ncbi:hypothetical protein L7A49_33000, partial [Achromobacter xylosoxidans]|nr:hypothetical protein [Achromobacter xylosoxidans]